MAGIIEYPFDTLRKRGLVYMRPGGNSSSLGLLYLNSLELEIIIVDYIKGKMYAEGN